MNQKKAFTLIELLVVIAVISVLMAILVPALTKARYQAKRITCMANMKGQLQAIIMYATENQGKYPRHNSPLPYYLTYPDYTNNSNPWEALKDTYITNGSTLICPVLAELGDMFGSTEFLTPDGIYGGWDTPTAYYNRISYNWYANHRPPNSSGDLSFDFGEKPWARNMAEGTESHTLITHSVFDIAGGGFYDYSHGGTGSAAGPGDLLESDILDNPVGQADGSVTFRTKNKMLPRVTFTNDVYGPVVYYY